MLVEVASTAELSEGLPTVFRVQDREVVITRWRGQFYALRNVCAHRMVPFSKSGYVGEEGRRMRGHVENFVTGGEVIGEWQVRDDVPVIRCPWHSWQYRLTDGGCMSEPKLRVKSYNVIIQDDKIFLEMGPNTKQYEPQS